MVENSLCLKYFNVVYIEDEDYYKLEKLIVDNFVSLCWGSANNSFFSIEDTINEFMIRFNGKSEPQQYGYIGEFLFYLYVLNNKSIIKPVSIFFNQEERSVKKGFDTLAFDGCELWYTEVKSGQNTSCIDVKNIERLNTAFFDIENKLREKDRNTNYWDTAKSKMCQIEFDKTKEREKVIQILDNDRANPLVTNAIVVSVIFDNQGGLFDEKKIKEKYLDFKSKNGNITVVCIRKKTIEKIIEILKKVGKVNG